ncbi:MAG: DNA polymerase III subunit chi [Pseudomonadota bacterium]
MRVDFYFIADQENHSFCCRLIEKAYQNNCRVYVRTVDDSQARQLDEQLWTFKQNSFIPHALQGAYQDNPPPIEIGRGDTSITNGDILLNLSHESMATVSGFNRVLEIIPNTPADNQRAETHLQAYQEKQFEIHQHQLRK